jgi:hypothetical protein
MDGDEAVGVWPSPETCDPANGLHVTPGDADHCQCGERPRRVWGSEEAPAVPLSPPPENNIVGCARCGGNHSLRFTEFVQPVLIGDEVAMTHWSLCPTTGDPILMRFVDPAE